MSTAQKLQTAYAHLKVTVGPHAGFEAELSVSPFTIGRGPDNNLPLEKDQKVSRQHLTIKLVKDQVVVSNISQKNFLLINGVRENERELEGISLVQIGESVIEISPVVTGAPKRDRILQVVAPNTTHSQFTNSFPTTVPTSSPAKSQQHAPAAPAWKPPPANPPVWHNPAQQNWNAGASDFGKSNHQKFNAPKIKNPNAPKPLFYLLVVAILVGAFFLFQDSKKKNNVDRGGFRKNSEIEQEVLSSQSSIKEFEARQEMTKSYSYQRAQENYVKGFREYRQGNYARARDHFQVVLNLDPSNTLALRYYNLSKVKFDEILQFNMIQGRAYREKKNYRLCKSNFQKVLVMIQNNPQHPQYNEANNFFNECSLALEGRY